LLEEGQGWKSGSNGHPEVFEFPSSKKQEEQKKLEDAKKKDAGKTSAAAGSTDSSVK
jgi:hypothetical protein